VADFTTAIGAAPAYIDAYRGRARAYEALGEADKARADHEKVKQLLMDKQP
jgi:Tfp pilus assembly protein PilF